MKFQLILVKIFHFMLITAHISNKMPASAIQYRIFFHELLGDGGWLIRELKQLFLLKENVNFANFQALTKTV